MGQVPGDAHREGVVGVGEQRQAGGAEPLAERRLAQEVVQHLTALVGAKVDVTLEIEANVPAGVPDTTMRTVLENCGALKFNSPSFEVE